MSLRGILAWLLLLLSVAGCNEILGLSEGSCFASCEAAFNECLEGFCPDIDAHNMFCGQDIKMPYDDMLGCTCGPCKDDGPHHCSEAECSGKAELSDACKDCMASRVDSCPGERDNCFR